MKVKCVSSHVKWFVAGVTYDFDGQQVQDKGCGSDEEHYKWDVEVTGPRSLRTDDGLAFFVRMDV